MKKRIRSSIICLLLFVGLTAAPIPATAAPPDPVLDWINVLNNAAANNFAAVCALPATPDDTVRPDPAS